MILPQALSGPVSHKEQLPAPILTEFGLPECLHGSRWLFCVAKPRPECSDKPYMLLQSFPCSRLNVQQFPSEDHNNWKLWYRPLDRILCVCLGRRQFSQETKYILKVHKSNKENKIYAFVIKHFCSVSYSYSLRAKNKFLQFSKNTC